MNDSAKLIAKMMYWYSSIVYTLTRESAGQGLLHGKPSHAISTKNDVNKCIFCAIFMQRYYKEGNKLQAE